MKTNLPSFVILKVEGLLSSNNQHGIEIVGHCEFCGINYFSYYKKKKKRLLPIKIKIKKTNDSKKTVVYSGASSIQSQLMCNM